MINVIKTNYEPLFWATYTCNNEGYTNYIPTLNIWLDSLISYPHKIHYAWKINKIQNNVER